jgi:gliding motility-associated-like protein
MHRIGKKILPILYLLIAGPLYAQLQAPTLLCNSVETDGSVILVWEPVSDPAGIFQEYIIYYSMDLVSGFTLIDTVTDISQTTYTHVSAAANDRSRFYYLVTGSTAGPSVTSDTLETIFLYFETDDNENISLYWNPTHDPPLPAPDVEYQVYREYPPGNWELLDQVQGLTYDHHFWLCNDPQHIVNFRVNTISLSTGCQSTSNITGTILSNLTQPDIPSIDSASITPQGQAIIGWQPGQAQDISGYIIYRVTDINDSIDFVPGADSTAYIDADAMPCDESVRYAIAAIDSCGNKSPGTFLIPHQTLYLQPIEYDPCFLVNTIYWNEYINFDPPLAGYELYVSVDDGPYTLLEVLSPLSTSYTHEDLTPTTKYSYYVRAFNDGRTKTSTSCTQEMNTYNSPFPQFMYLRYVTVQEDNSIEVSFYSDTSAHVNGYKVFRSEDMASFTEIGQVAPAGSDIMFFTDDEVETWNNIYYYRVSVIDSCDNESFIANTSRSVLLQVESGEDLINVLTWNAYESWDADVSGYRIFRRVGKDSPEQLVYEAGPGELVFEDDVSVLSDADGWISYYVEAFEGQGNQYGFEDVSRSNEVLADVIEKVYVPNAIVPNGQNNRLKPVGAFINDKDYLFSIYNRWGQLIFQTKDPEEAWYGKYNGKYVEQGVYVYILRFTTATGEVFLRKGTVAVIF